MTSLVLGTIAGRFELGKDVMINIGDRRELFVDQYLVESLEKAAPKLHAPQPAPSDGGMITGDYVTVFRDGDRYRAYYRQYDPSYQGERKDGNEGEVTFYAESPDGIAWEFPEFGLYEVNGSRRNNAVLRQVPYSHNFAPFLDTNPATSAAARYKALAGTHPTGGRPGTGLHAFQSADGLRWEPMREAAVITHDGFAFDSQNVAFWSAAEGCYVCYYRTWLTSKGKLRTITRRTSPDFVNWGDPVCMDPNLPGESLYTSQTHPYFRAPHIYVALPTRFQPARGCSTDILFMTTRAGATHYDRLFTEAYIRPGLDPARWGNRSNYAACGVVPTGPAEMSLYHGRAGQRYTLRTDGFISIHAGSETGRMTTRPFIFTGRTLSLNAATSAAGILRVELQDEQGRASPGLAFADCDGLIGDGIAHTIAWKGNPDVAAWAGRPVRLCFEMNEADLYSLRFEP